MAGAVAGVVAGGSVATGESVGGGAVALTVVVAAGDVADVVALLEHPDAASIPNTAMADTDAVARLIPAT